MVEKSLNPGQAISQVYRAYDAQSPPGESRYILSRWSTVNNQGLYCIVVSYDLTGTKDRDTIWESEHTVGMEGNNCGPLDRRMAADIDWYQLKGLWSLLNLR